MKPKVEVKKKRGLLEYYDSDAQVASWDEEKAALMKACDRLEQEFDKRDRSGDTVVMRVAFKEVLVAYVRYLMYSSLCVLTTVHEQQLRTRVERQVHLQAAELVLGRSYRQGGLWNVLALGSHAAWTLQVHVEAWLDAWCDSHSGSTASVATEH